jgi:tetratricopeptide (TPR) repeat protein
VDAGEFLATGEAVNLAARLQQQASPNSIVIDERTFEATRRVIQTQALPAPVKGDFAMRPRWEVVGLAAGPATKRLRARMVGREGEMQFLQALYRRVAEGRRHHLVTVTGPAGSGKSRLTEEFLATLRDEPDGPQILNGRCPAYGEGLTYWPVAVMLKLDFGIKDNDPPAAVTAKLRDGVHHTCAGLASAEECDAIAAGLAPVLGVEVPRHGDIWREQLQALRRTAEGRSGALEDPGAAGAVPSVIDTLLRSLRAFLVAKASKRPLVLVFEDLHWAEESLLDLLEHLAIRAPDASILTLCLARPELLERHPQWGGRIRNYTAVSLSPLPDSLGRQLIADLLRGEAVPADVRDGILAKAEGNPFFIEEILRMLIDGGTLVRDEEGWRWASYPVEIRIPNTIHGILASRLDLLSPLEKRVVQDASLMGRTFWLGALIATSGLHPAEVVAALERLQEREVVEERGAASLAGEREFAFTHALIREVAYASLPKAQRSSNHLRFAQWVEGAAGTDEEFLEVLAHHYEQAWRYRFEAGDKGEDLARKAIEVLRKAGGRAAALRTLPEAQRLYERALAILRNAGLTGDVPFYLELLTDRSEVAKWMATSDVVLEDTDILLQLAPSIGRDDLLARAWLNRAFAEYNRNRLEPAEEAIRRALTLFRERKDRGGEAEALEVLGFITEDLRGSLTTAHNAYREAFDLYREMNDGQGMARTMARLGRALLDNGRLADSLRVLTEATRLAREHREPLSDANAVTGLAVLAHLTGDDAEAVRLFREAIEIRHDLGNLLAEAATRHRLGMHYLRAGRVDDAEQEFRAGRALRRMHGLKGESSLLLRGLAETSLARGDLLSASEQAEQALAAVGEHDALARAAYAATLGKIRAAQGRRDEAESLFRGSLEILEAKEYPIDLALTLLRYGEALLLLNEPQRARAVLERAQMHFREMGATRLVGEVDARLERIRATGP